MPQSVQVRDPSQHGSTAGMLLHLHRTRYCDLHKVPLLGGVFGFAYAAYLYLIKCGYMCVATALVFLLSMWRVCTRVLYVAYLGSPEYWSISVLRQRGDVDYANPKWYRVRGNGPVYTVPLPRINRQIKSLMVFKYLVALLRNYLRTNLATFIVLLLCYSVFM
jgi:hypothetical protein